jgi:hypothetical protein
MSAAVLVGLLGLGVCIILAAFRLAERREDPDAKLAERVDELTAENQRLRRENVILASANERLAAGVWHPSLRRQK